MSDQPAEAATIIGIHHTTDFAVWRAALRREKIAARQALDPDTHRQASRLILDNLGQFLAARPAGTIAFCWPIRAEVDCRPLVGRLLAAGWQAAMPTVVQADTPMEFRTWWPDAPMQADPYGIPIPATPAVPAPDVLLLPLVACDAAGYRLGYGGGYFDRTLASCQPRPLAIGIGFELCRVDSIHPEAHDIPIDVLVTENSIESYG
jgi:5,10-methenyltetrahydrofolate synthetase